MFRGFLLLKSSSNPRPAGQITPFCTFFALINSLSGLYPSDCKALQTSLIAHFLHKQVCHTFSGLHDPVALLMHIPVHGGLDIRVSCDCLQRLDIRHHSLRIGQKAVPEYMPSRAMQVDRFGDPLECPLEGHFRDRFVAANDEGLPCPDRLQVLAQHPHDRDLPGAFFCVGVPICG